MLNIYVIQGFTDISLHSIFAPTRSHLAPQLDERAHSHKMFAVSSRDFLEFGFGLGLMGY